MDTTAKEFLAIEFKRTQDVKMDYVERATAVAQKQYKSLLSGLQAVGQAKEWKVQQIVFVGGTSGSIHTDSFNSNMKALGFLESKWDFIRKKRVRRLFEEQDKVIRSYFAQKGGSGCKGGHSGEYKGREHGTCMSETGEPGPRSSSLLLIKGEHGHGGRRGFLVFSFFSVGCVLVKFIKLIKFVVQ